MARQRSHRGKEVRDGPLSGHFKTGRTYLPPIMAMKGYTSSDWARTDLPDLIWPLLLVAGAGNRGAYVFSQAQQAVLAQIEPGDFPEGAGLDGRLTSLEAIEEERREQILRVLREHPLAAELFDNSVLGVVRLYGSRLPGSWLFAGIEQEGAPLSEEDALAAMANSIVEVLSDRHLNALVKAAPFGWMLQSGRLQIGPGMADELIGYPMVEENVGKADAFILSSYLTTKMMVPADVEQARLSWASDYWSANWSMTECVPEEAVETEDDDSPANPDQHEKNDSSESDAAANADHPLGSVQGHVEAGIGSVFDIYNDFLETVIQPDVPLDLLSPARFEVLAGLVARAFRSAVSILRAPHQWSGEQAAPTMRSLVESRIVTTWLIGQNDDAWFEQYQAYGRGKRKLQSSIVDNLVEQAGDNIPDDMAEFAESLKAKVGGEHGAMFQEVSVDSTFAGKSLRAMAEEAGLSDDYKFLFQVQSGVTHGEWWALEDYALQRCLNPLHRFHYLPTFEPAYPPTERFPEVLIAEFEQLVEIAANGITRQEEPGDGISEEP